MQEHPIIDNYIIQKIINKLSMDSTLLLALRMD